MRGFWHPSRGYWETLSAPSAAVRATYPAGTVEMNPEPGKVFDGEGFAVPPTPDEPVPPLSPPQWGFLRRRDGGRLNGVIEAAKAVMPPGDLSVMFAEIVDKSGSINIATVLALTAKVRAMAPALDVPTDAEIRTAWDAALKATPEELMRALDAL